MSRRFLSIMIILCFVVTALIAFNPLSGKKVSAEEYREGFHLSPKDSDSTGVKPSSRFLLKSQNNVTLEEIQSILSIDGEPAPAITETAENTFEITPAEPFQQNALVTFRLKQQDKADVTWTFQTSAPFRIINAFPGDKSTGVPVNSGIEIYFSHDNYEDIDKYFEITPSVPGRFERHKKAVVFVPRGLEKSTLYTVKVKKGLKLSGSEQVLSEDYVFMFETAADENTANDRYNKGYFSYNRTLNEFSPSEKPYLPIYYYVNHDPYKNETVRIKTSIYAYKNLDDFIKALEQKDAIPGWAYESFRNHKLSVGGLAKAAEFEAELPVNPRDQMFIEVPSNLPAGYYLVDSVWEDLEFQTLLQVTDIGMYLMKSTTKTLVWINDLSSDRPMKDVTLTLAGKNTEYKTDASGIAYFDFPEKAESSQNINPSTKYFKVNAPDGRSAVLVCSTPYYLFHYGMDGTDLYWDYMQTDRNIYKPNDTIHLWGLLKNRYSDEQIHEVTIEIGEGYRWFMPYAESDIGLKGGYRLHYFPMESQPMLKQTLKVENGVFQEKVELPWLQPGGYQLTVKKGTTTIASTYLSIENYSKPAYRLEISKNKEAVFAGEEIQYKIQSSFFEGTAVPDLKVDYSLSSGIGDAGLSGSETTNQNGSITVHYNPKPSADAQGENQAWLYAHASLPEIGDITANSNVRVFVNDIHVRFESEIKDGIGKLRANVNTIVLDRLNDGTAEDSNDFLGDAVAGKSLTGKIYKTTWLKIEDGDYYDFINKVTQKRYRYEPKKESVMDFNITTDSEGKAEFAFDVPEADEGYYTAELKCLDNSGRNMKFEVYIGNDFLLWYDFYQDSRYYLDGGKESYRLGEDVSLTFKKGKEVLPKGSYLFIQAQNGIRDYSLSASPEYSFTMKDSHVPNTYIYGVYFNGITYVSSETFYAVYDSGEKNLLIEAEVEKQAYRPGDEAVIKITAKDASGKPQKATVNASLVDEAIFKLHEQYVDTLAALYRDVPTGVDFTYSSHENSGRDDYTGARNQAAVAATAKLEGGRMEAPAPMPLANIKMMALAEEDSASGDGSYIREVFKDTAYFETITLDENGRGELRFKLPDNVTSWRVTLSGVTSDLYAGSNKTSLNVTLPFFINYTLNNTYLVGDTPVIGVNAYGNDLAENETVVFEVSSASDPTRTVRAEGKAFERVNIPLWPFAEGKDELIIKASSAGGMTDSLKHKVTVVKTYHELEEAKYYDLSPGLVFESGTAGNTTLIFTDKSRGQFLPHLTALLYSGGNRVDQKLPAQIASQLLAQYFDRDDLAETDTSFRLSDYQTYDGGIALLPYGSSDIEISALIGAMSLDGIDEGRMKQYLYSQLYDETLPGLKGSALYALAAMKEPVLLDIDKAAGIDNMDIKDAIFLALAYCELGEKPKAERLFHEKIMRKAKDYSPFLRIDTGKDNEDITEATLLAALLASRLDKPEKSRLYGYTAYNSTPDILTNLQRLLYIREEIEKYKGGRVKFTYSYLGEKRVKELQSGESFRLEIPSAMASEFSIESVEGEVALVSMYKRNRSQVYGTDENINISRTYGLRDGSKKGNTFRQNDIVRVELNVDLGPKAMDGGYEITDYLPSGLKPIENPWEFGISTGDNYLCFREIDGQKVTFYVYNDERKEVKSYHYYARVINPGTFKADAPVIQGIASRSSINIGKADTITIEK